MEIAVDKAAGVAHQEGSASHLVWPYSISAIPLLTVLLELQRLERICLVGVRQLHGPLLNTKDNYLI